jgi:hypothetical protein
MRNSLSLTLCNVQSAERYESGALKRSIDPSCSDHP